MEATMQEKFDKWLSKIQPDFDKSLSYEHGFHDAIKVVSDRLELQKKEPYGWVIEQNSTNKYSDDSGKTYKWAPWSGWKCNKHLYLTKDKALEAIKAKRESNSFADWKVSYRILPVYSGEPEVLDNILDLPLKIEEDEY